MLTSKGRATPKSGAPALGVIGFNRMNIIIVLSLLLTAQPASSSVTSEHKLLKNEHGQYYVINSLGVVMIAPEILSYGESDDWIIACIKNQKDNADLKRMVILKKSNGTSVDTINQDHWEYFIKEIPSINYVQVRSIASESCP